MRSMHRQRGVVFIAAAAVSAGIATGVGVAVGSVTLAAAGAFFATAFITSAALGLVSRAMAKKPGEVFQAQNRLVTTRQPIKPWEVVFGRVRKGGVLTFRQISADRNYWHMVITLACHRVEAIDEIWFNEKRVPLDSNGAGLGYWAQNSGSPNNVEHPVATAVRTVPSSGPYVVTLPSTFYALSHVGLLQAGSPSAPAALDGAMFQSAPYDPLSPDEYKFELVGSPATPTFTFHAGLAGREVRISYFAAAFDLRSFVKVQKSLGDDASGTQPFPDLVTDSGGVWSSDHKQYGHTKIYVRLEKSSRLFPGGPPNVTVVMRGALAEDPRIGSPNGVTAYTANPALLAAHYFRNTEYGLGAAESEVHRQDLAAAASSCDEAVSLGAGGSEPRYRANGTFSTSDKPVDVLRNLLASMLGSMVNQGDTWRVNAGVYSVPTVTFSETHLAGPSTVVSHLPSREAANAVKGVFINPQAHWQPDSFPAIQSATYAAEDGGETNWKSLDLTPFVTSITQAQRLAKIELLRMRQSLTEVVTTKIPGWRAIPGRTVARTDTDYGWTAKAFEVEESEFQVVEGDGGPVLAVQLRLRETAAAVYDWSTSEEGAVDLAPNTSLADLLDGLDVGALTMASGTAQLFVAGDGTVYGRIRVEFAAVSSPWVTHYELRFKPAAATDWSLLTAPIGEDPVVAYLSPVEDGVTYDINVRAVTQYGEGDWTEDTHTVIGKTAPPTDVTGAIATQQGTLVIFSCDQIDDPDLDCIEIRIAQQGATDWDLATTVTRIVRGHTVSSAAVPPGEYTFFFRSVDTSGNYSTGVVTFDLDVTTGGYAEILAQEEAQGWIRRKDYQFRIESNGLVSMGGPSVGTGDFTVAFNFNPDSVGSSQRIVDKFLAVNGWAFTLDAAGTVTPAIGDTAFNNTAVGGAVWTAGDDQRLLCTFDRDGLCTLYRNGASIGTKDISAISGNCNGPATLRFGQNAVTTQDFTGTLWDVQVWDRVLSADEIAVVDAGEDVNFGLLGRWRGNNTAADESGYGHHGTLSGGATYAEAAATFCRHWTGVLVVESTKAASEHTIAELFEEFVPYPVAVATWPTGELDKLIDADARLYRTIGTRAGRDRTDGDVQPLFMLDHRRSDAEYDGYEDWTVGTANFRYAHGKIILDTSLGIPVITELTLTVDAPSRLEEHGNVAIGAAGTTLDFEEPFHLTPSIQITPVGTSALIPTVESPSNTGFTAHLYNTAGAGAAGNANISAFGV